MIEWGGWGDPPTAAAVLEAMALRHMDYYLMKPLQAPDEQFHRTVAEFLQEWSRARAPSASEMTLVARDWSQRGYELRDLLARNGVPARISLQRFEGRAPSPSGGRDGSHGCAGGDHA